MIKGVTTMHKVLQPQLPQEQLKEVYSRICELLNTKVPKHFEDVSPATPAGQQRVVDDVVHLATTLSRLRAVQARARARGESARARRRELTRPFRTRTPRCSPPLPFLLPQATQLTFEEHFRKRFPSAS